MICIGRLMWQSTNSCRKKWTQRTLVERVDWFEGTLKMTDLIELRDAVSADVSRIVDLNEEALPTVNSVPAEFFRGFLDGRPRETAGAAIFRVAVDQVSDEAVGFLLALRPGEAYDSVNYRWFSARYSHFLYVDRIVIGPEAQGKGLGPLMYRDLVQAGERLETPPQRICCEVNLRPRNEQSLRFHQRFGFKPQGSHETEGGKKFVSLLTYSMPPVQPS